MQKIKLITFTIMIVNLIYLSDSYASINGVNKVEIKNWTRTREANEIPNEEKVFNSAVFSNIKEINTNENIQKIEDLFNERYEMRSLNGVKNDNNLIKGNKILRGKISTNKPYKFDYEKIRSWVGSDKDFLWKDGNCGSKILSWLPYSEVINDEEYSPVEWRMIEGNFNLSEEEYKLIKSKKIQPVIGIETNTDNNFELMIPFNDLLNIFIDEQPTHLNYEAISNKFVLPMSDDNQHYYRNLNEIPTKKYCNEKHNIFCNHTNNKHLDCNILSLLSNKMENDNKEDIQYYKMIGDISDYIKIYKDNYKISLLVGQVARKGENVETYGGGISKINLYLIENPKFDVTLKPYIIKNNKKIYIDSNYKFAYNEEVLFELEINNYSNNFDYSNLNLNIIKDEKSSTDKIKNNLQIHIAKDMKNNNVVYNGEDISNSINASIDNKNGNIRELTNLKKNESLIISSDKLKFNITEYNSFVEKIFYKYTAEFNYLDDYTFYKMEQEKRIPIKPIGGILKVEVKGDEKEYFYMNLKSENNSANIKIRGGQSFTLYNLDYDKVYKLSFINSSLYEPKNSEEFTLKNSSNSNKKSIIINTTDTKCIKKKTNNYFIQRKIEEITTNR